MLYPMPVAVELCVPPSDNQFLSIGYASNVSQVFFLTLPTQCFLLPWNIAESSKTSCSVRQGCLEACGLFSKIKCIVDNHARRFVVYAAIPPRRSVALVRVRRSCKQLSGTSIF